MYTRLFTSVFFFNYPATTEIYTLSLHDALPISEVVVRDVEPLCFGRKGRGLPVLGARGRRTDVMDDLALLRLLLFNLLQDRKSTRLNSSHMSISYAVFCLKKKKKKKNNKYLM